MITYELAKELKDTGFLQESGGAVFPSVYYEDSGETIKYRHIENDEGVKIPTLSELIEACGKRFYGVRRSGEQWVAQTVDIEALGSTPEETVARLWLILNT